MSMKETILKPKLNATGWFELVGIGAAKILEEKATAPIIGNGSLFSGISKGVIGAVIHTYGGDNIFSRIAGGAFLVDAGEDLALSAMNMVGMGATQQTAGADW